MSSQAPIGDPVFETFSMILSLHRSASNSLGKLGDLG